MSSPNKDWYSHLVVQSLTVVIYNLRHCYLEPDCETGHNLDFVVVRRCQLPETMKDIPAKHLSKKLLQTDDCFPGNGYLYCIITS